MKESSEAHRYEEAARYRDLIEGIQGMVEKQKVVIHGAGDRDIVGLATVGKRAAACVLHTRGGTLSGKRIEMLGQLSDDEAITLESFLLQWYSGFHEIPREVLLSHKIEGTKALIEILSERKGAKVKITVPQKGERLGLTRLAMDNAREALRLKADTSEAIVNALENLKGKLMLPRVPDVIECLDISNIGGRDAYGSLVTFVTGEPDKSRYRLYRIQTVKTPDDYAMMREVLERRYSRHGPPDLLLIDGGKGQLNVATKVLGELGIMEIPVAAIAKGESKGRETDDIYLPGRKNPLKFRRGSKELLLLMRIRDEAHRFGIKAHRKRRIKGMLSEG
jgi:excinuclease ABC subunit C